MVQYRTEYQRNPGPAAAAKLTNYVARGEVGRVERAAGMQATDADVEGFQRVATNAEMTRLHSFTFLEDRTPEELTDGIRSVLRDYLDGSYLVGVNIENDGNNHLHIAQAGIRMTSTWTKTISQRSAKRSANSLMKTSRIGRCEHNMIGFDLFGAGVAVVLALPGAEIASEWWATLSLVRQLAYGGFVGVLGLLVVNVGVGRVLGVSLFAIVLWLIRLFSVSDGTMTGREDYDTSVGTTLQRRFSRSDENTIPVDEGEDAVEEWDAMAELWESGKMQEMIESGDFSDLPDSVRPDESDGSDS